MMYENIHGFSCIENQILAILNQRKERIELTYHNCAIPLQELYLLIVKQGIKQEHFNSVQRVQDILKEHNIISFSLNHAKNFKILTDDIKSCSKNEYILIRVTSEFSKNILNARGLRADHYVLVNAVENKYQIFNDIPEHIEIVNDEQLLKAFDRNYFKLTVLKNLTNIDADIIWEKRIYKPEIQKLYSKNIVMFDNLNEIDNFGIKLRNMIGIYKIFRRRMVEYYGIYIDTEFIRNKLPLIDKMYALIEYYNLKKNIKCEKYLGIINELVNIDISIMEQLHTALGDINYVPEKNRQYFNGNCIS